MHNSPLENAKRERLAQLLAQGETRSSAYYKAGYKPKSKAAAANACGAALRRHPEIRARVKTIQLQASQEAVLTLALKRKYLHEIAANPATESKARIAAMAEDARLMGEHAPDRQQLLVASADSSPMAADDRARRIEAARRLRQLSAVTVAGHPTGVDATTPANTHTNHSLQANITAEKP